MPKAERKQYTTASSGTVAALDTQQDVQIIHDNALLTVSLTINFPANPVDGQRFGVTSAAGITTLNLSSSLTIIGSVNTLIGGGFATYMYDKNSNKWFRVG